LALLRQFPLFLKNLLPPAFFLGPFRLDAHSFFCLSTSPWQGTVAPIDASILQEFFVTYARLAPGWFFGSRSPFSISTVLTTNERRWAFSKSAGGRIVSAMDRVFLDATTPPPLPSDRFDVSTFPPQTRRAGFSLQDYYDAFSRCGRS